MKEQARKHDLEDVGLRVAETERMLPSLHARVECKADKTDLAEFAKQLQEVFKDNLRSGKEHVDKSLDVLIRSLFIVEVHNKFRMFSLYNLYFFFNYKFERLQLSLLVLLLIFCFKIESCAKTRSKYVLSCF